MSAIALSGLTSCDADIDYGCTPPSSVSWFCRRLIVARILLHCSANLDSCPAGEYVCNDCGKIMTDRQGFNNHILIHSEARNFVCDVCSKAFRTSKNLHQHKLSHQPPRHECPYCQKKFIYACGLRAHKKQVHENPTAVVAVGGVAGHERGGGVIANPNVGVSTVGLIPAATSISSTGHSLLNVGLSTLTSSSSLIGRPADPTMGVITTPTSALQAMTSVMSSAVIPSGVITQNDLQKVMNSHELEKVMNPGELTLNPHPHHHPLHLGGATHSLLGTNVGSGNGASLASAAKLVDGAGVNLPNHAATLSKLAAGDITATMGKMNPNELNALCKLNPLELSYLG